MGAWNFVEVSPSQVLGRFNGFSRDDLSVSVQLEQIPKESPEQRHFNWRSRAALASRSERERLRNVELRRARELYAGMAVSGGVMSSKTLQLTAGMRK